MDSNFLKRALRALLPLTYHRPATQLLALALVALSAASCAWSQPPSRSDAIIAPYKINGSTDKVDAGELILVQEGLWAYLPEASAKDKYDFEAGALVGFLPQKRHASAHVYGVVLVRSWGALLQRLDSQPVTGTELRGEFIGIDNDPKFRQWGLCRGASADIRENPCIKEASASTRWRIFQTDAIGHLITPDLDSWSSALPIRSAGLLIGERSVMRPGTEPGLASHWLAVPAHRPQRSRAQNAPHLAHARVAMGEGCPKIDFTESFQPLEVFNTAIDTPTDPIDTSVAAIRTGADVLVRCKGNSVWVDIPFLYRPTLAVADTSAQGVAYGAMQPIELKGQSVEVQRATILMGAALATGSVFAADFYLQEALQAGPDSGVSRDLGLKFMQVFAAAGRPEAALRSGHKAAGGAWHLDNNPQFVLGRTWVNAALGRARAYSDDITRLGKLAETPENTDIRLWLAWSTVRADALKGSGQSVRGALSYFDHAGLIRWLQAANLIVAPSLRIELEKHETSALGLALALVFSPEQTRADGQSCADKGVCQLDVYGRNFAARLSAASDEPALLQLIDDLGQTSMAAIRPGFEVPAQVFEGFSAPQELAIRAALMPLIQPGERRERFDELVAAATRAVRAEGNCVKIPGASIISARLDADSHAASPRQLPLLRATGWLVGDAFEAACHRPLEFADSLDKSLGQDEALARQIIPLLSALSEHTTPETRAQILGQVADFSAQHKTGAACTRFNLALAFSNATAGQLDAAAQNLSKTVNCTDRDAEKYAPSQQILNAYLRFETSGQIPSGLGSTTHQALVDLTRGGAPSSSPKACVGLEPLTFDLEAYMHPEIVALAVSLPEPEPDDLALETSTRSLNRAISALQVAHRYLAEGRPAPAADSLLEAQAAFARIQHQVGLRRISFLAATIYGSDLESYQATQQLIADADAPTQSKPKSEPISLAKPETLSAQDWSRALQQGQADTIGALFDAAHLPPSAEAARAWTAAKLLRGAASSISLPYQKLGAQQSALESLCK